MPDITIWGIETVNESVLFNDLRTALGVLISSAARVGIDGVTVVTSRATTGDEERSVRSIVHAHDAAQTAASTTSIPNLKTSAEAVSIDPAVVLVLLTWQTNVKKKIDWLEAEVRRLRNY